MPGNMSTPDASGGAASPEGGSPVLDASTPQADSGTAAPESDAGPIHQPDANTGGDADTVIADGGAPAEPDGSSGAGPDAAVIPPPVTEPQVTGFGIGITDVPNAVKFYTEVMKMTVEKQGVQREGKTETVLYASEAKRGARIVLMNFADMRNTRKITAKLVFQASSPGAVNTAASKFPDYKSRLNFGIVQFDGPETYIHEVGSIFDSGSGARVPYPIAMGFVVSDLAASRRFYTALGMDESRTGSFSVEDATGSGNITEYTVKFKTGSALVLQQWRPMRNAKDNPIKAVFAVPDAKAVADKLVAAGGSIVTPAARSAVYDNRLLVVAKDLDGYILDLVE